MAPAGSVSPSSIDPIDPTHTRGRRLSFSSSAVREAPTNLTSSARARAASGAVLASSRPSQSNISIDSVRYELSSVSDQLEHVQRRALARRVPTVPAASHGYSLRSSSAVDAFASTTAHERAHGDQNFFRGAHAQHAPRLASGSDNVVSSPSVLSQHPFSDLSVSAMADAFEPPRIEGVEGAPARAARALNDDARASSIGGHVCTMDSLGGVSTVTELSSASPDSNHRSIGAASSTSDVPHEERGDASLAARAAQPHGDTRAHAGAASCGARRRQRRARRASASRASFGS